MEVELWENEFGRSPIADFISKIKDNELKNKISDTINLLEKHGLATIEYAPKGLKKLSGYNMYELRIKNKRILIRILFAIVGITAWLLHGFQKQSKKTPAKEIKTAINRANTIQGYKNY